MTHRDDDAALVGILGQAVLIQSGFASANANPSPGRDAVEPDPTQATYLPLVMTGPEHALAGVEAYCSNSGSTIHRAFNNANNNQITISDGAGLGYCTIDFGFDISDKIILATVSHPDTPSA